MIEIGSRPGAPQDAVDLLLDCHARIRSFARLAARIAEQSGASDREVAESAARVRRYFALALPLHVADEEESVLPRLAGRDPALDAALSRMEAEHEGHEEDVGRLVALSGALAEDPGALPFLRGELQAVADRLVRAFDEHLRAEEEVVFPAVRKLLSSEELKAILAEVRARRRSP